MEEIRTIISDASSVEERAHKRPTVLKLLEKAAVIDAEPKRFGGCVEIGTINEERHSAGVWC